MCGIEEKSLSLYFRIYSDVCRWILTEEDQRRVNLINTIYTSLLGIIMNEAIRVTSNDWTIRSNLSNSQHQFFVDQSKFPTRQATTVGAILAFVFIFFGLVGNLILITTILSVKKLRSNIINIFIVSVRFD